MVFDTDRRRQSELRFDLFPAHVQIGRFTDCHPALTEDVQLRRDRLGGLRDCHKPGQMVPCRGIGRQSFRRELGKSHNAHEQIVEVVSQPTADARRIVETPNRI